MRVRLPGGWEFQFRVALKRRPVIAALERQPEVVRAPAAEGGITAVVNGYRRPDNLTPILEALHAQTVPPQDVLVWYNGWDPRQALPPAVMREKVALSTHNWGVWARFAYALNAATKYVCVFDDDTIPGPRWFENCLNTMVTHRGVLGTKGVIFSESTGYPFIASRNVGWEEPNREVIEVDLVGHAWFFEREWLGAFFREPPPPGFELVGEDMHLSYAVQKYLGLRTHVPPHPPEDASWWGSTRGRELGGDDVSIWRNEKDDTRRKMADYQRLLVEKGWRTLVAQSG